MGLHIGHSLFVVPEAWQALSPSQDSTRGPETAAAGMSGPRDQGWMSGCRCALAGATSPWCVCREQRRHSVHLCGSQPAQAAAGGAHVGALVPVNDGARAEGHLHKTELHACQRPPAAAQHVHKVLHGPVLVPCLLDQLDPAILHCAGPPEALQWQAAWHTAQLFASHPV